MFYFPAIDVTDPSSVKAAAVRVTEQLKGAGLNLLINNAGIARHSTLESETPENMTEGYNINVIGPLMVSQVSLSFQDDPDTSSWKQLIL